MRRLAITLYLLGAGVAAMALLGPLALSVIDYHVVDDVLNQVRGGDAVGLALVAPTAVVAGLLVHRGHRAGPPLALGVAGYATYTAVQLALGGEFATAPGTSERFFPLFLAVAVLGGAAMLQAWTAVASTALPPLGPRVRRGVLAVVFVLAAFLTLGLHLPGLVDVVGGPPHGIEYTQSPTVFWVVKMMDLALVVPVALATGVGLLRGAGWASRLVYAVVAWGALLGSAVAAMGVVMVVHDDPAATLGGTVVLGLLAAAFLALAVALFRPLFRAGPAVTSSAAAPASAGRP